MFFRLVITVATVFCKEPWAAVSALIFSLFNNKRLNTSTFAEMLR